jgi:hypothetical protein
VADQVPAMNALKDKPIRGRRAPPVVRGPSVGPCHNVSEAIELGR